MSISQDGANKRAPGKIPGALLFADDLFYILNVSQ
jgi:hypothetical protein